MSTSHCFRENPHDLVILSHNLKWKLFLQGWSNQTTHQHYYARHPAGILFFRHSKLFLRQSFKGVHIFTVVDICWTTNFSLAFVIVFLFSLSFLLPIFIILTFCSHLLPSSLSVELFSSWPPSAYLFWFFIFFYTFSLLPVLII